MPEIFVRPCSSFREEKSSSLNGCCLIMPSVSVGNVGQLAIDVLISTLNVEKFGIVHHPSLLPIVGHDPYNENSAQIATASDLYICKEKNIILMQIRSPLIRGGREAFLKSLQNWTVESGLSRIIVLSSCHAHLRHDKQIHGVQFRYVDNAKDSDHLDLLKSIGPPSLEEREDEFGNSKQQIPGAGFAYRLVEMSELPCTLLLNFVDEGDNTLDASNLVQYLNAWVKLLEPGKKWKQPFSWKNLFGSPPPQSIY